ncbi:mRNA-binding protein NAB2 [Aspergillus clavatus NRRL 1]|uniref:Nuclear polyadenylated RNA-binding protein Nab2, putative n=1 Tax=Aspergillus clavatus (strain ATCC 1007 / CBS 513.65 / DSM 816 / NCTC 3887 / NRRL 1 / QM 1276 / 107) TaxID=344612 RepID=A1CT94_ASPCL|nr:nuclear polyadenylated RNA-binding protein Nab2, putative [Aspergillus clavatus NRRL 1]EAW06531.1 nuclear polyadenylated RNA-binding protein Nab2, putative [Aspergillus clavatus NRRL 1]
MASVVAAGSPLEQALSNVIPPKLVEMGWSSDGGDDSALTEYVILMLRNGKTQEQIANELSNDLLGLGEGDTQALDFSRWLFDQVEILNRQINGGGAPTANQSAPTQAIPSFNDQTPSLSHNGLRVESSEQDAEMGMEDAAAGDDSIPTGPKAMRGGRQAGRGRMLNQINRTLDRNNDSSLHRVRGQQGRVNSHGRDQKGRFHQNGGGRRQGNGMGMGPNQAMMNMTSQDQMHLMSLLEEQARMMAQFMPGFVSPAINPAFQQNAQQQQGRSLFDRVERQGRPHGHSNRAHNQGAYVKSKGDADTDMDTKPDGAQDENNTDSVCRFNLRCSRKDCPFAHQSPAAPEGTPVDVADPCPYGAACKNRKCTGRHPSPAVRSAHQAEELCKFFPNCANPHCHFKHPSMPLCRNGADCSTEGCKFTHLQTACKFNPCLNPSCPYKHAEGQKGAFPDKVWSADSNKPRVSERKFVSDENATEELIKPGAPTEDSTQNQEVVT